MSKISAIAIPPINPVYTTLKITQETCCNYAIDFCQGLPCINCLYSIFNTNLFNIVANKYWRKDENC